MNVCCLMFIHFSCNLEKIYFRNINVFTLQMYQHIGGTNICIGTCWHTNTNLFAIQFNLTHTICQLLIMHVGLYNM